MPSGTQQQREWVEQVLGVKFGPAPAADAAEASGAAVRLAKGLLLWNSTRSHVASEVMKLQQAIVAEMQDHPEFDDIVANIGNLEEVLEHLDDRLSDKLGELRAATDPAAKNKISAQARKIVAEMQTYASSDPLMQDIDDNGFIPLDVKPRVEQALAAILKTI